jgi:acyl carrier protein
MTADEIRAAILQVLDGIAPEADYETLKPDADLRDSLDLDSMDFLNFAIGLHEALGIDIPEADYPKLATLDHAIAYVAAKTAAASGVPS